MRAIIGEWVSACLDVLLLLSPGDDDAAAATCSISRQPSIEDLFRSSSCIVLVSNLSESPLARNAAMSAKPYSCIVYIGGAFAPFSVEMLGAFASMW